MRTKTTPVSEKLYNLVKWISQEGKKRKEATLLYNVPYGMALGLKKRNECNKNIPGTFFTIEPN